MKHEMAPSLMFDTFAYLDAALCPCAHSEVGMGQTKRVIVSIISIGVEYSTAEMLFLMKHVCLEFRRRKSPLLHMWKSKLRMSPSSRNQWTLTGLQRKVQQMNSRSNVGSRQFQASVSSRWDKNSFDRRLPLEIVIQGHSTSFLSRALSCDVKLKMCVLN